MKKILCVILALSMLFAFVACTKGGTTPNEPETVENLTGTLEEIAAQIYSNVTTIEMMLMDPMEIDLADADTAKGFLGVASTESIERAVFSEPMIGSIAYSMCLVKVKEGADIDALKNEILEGVNFRKWVCVAAEKIAVVNCGDTIMMVMATEEIVDDVCNAFATVSNGNASAPLTKVGEIQEEYVEGDVPMDDDVVILG